jgi:anti-sigma B factor antagonist
MNVLLSCLRASREKDVEFALTGLRPAVKKILQVTGLDSVFTIAGEQTAVPGE